ncbi:MAG: DNA repair and recombination protein RadB [Thermoplasmata archaeon]|nr:DNA repair and recombination protein RadB [Thermoplasmata archaeon]
MMKISTGCESIDELLGGGIEMGTITEVYGEAGTGKTNFCIQLARTVILSGKKVVYIDTEGLSQDRIRQICGDDSDLVMKNLLIFEPYAFDEQEKIVDKAVSLALKNEDIGLVILDSATLHYRIESGHDTERGERKSLTRQITAMLRLCRKRKIAVVLTSQVYTDVDVGIFKPLGGHVLHHNAKTIIRLDKMGQGLREMVLMKHRSLAEGKKVLFRLTECGLECVEKP